MIGGRGTSSLGTWAISPGRFGRGCGAAFPGGSAVGRRRRTPTQSAHLSRAKRKAVDGATPSARSTRSIEVLPTRHSAMGIRRACGFALRTVMKLHFVNTMDEVLAHALERPLPEVVDEEPTIPAIPPAPETSPTAHQ